MSGNGIASAQGTVVFSLPASATTDPCAQPQPGPAAFPVAQRSTLSPNASPFVPKNFALPVVAATATPQAPFAVAAAAPTAADSDMSYTPALPTNVQTIYVTGLPGYYAPYVPTPAVPFYAMQYQCVYQPPPPPPPHAHPAHMGGVCCPMEEGGLAPPPLIADEAPPTAAMLPPGGTGPHHHHLQASGPGNALLPHPVHHHQQQQQPTMIIQNSGRRNKKKSRSGRRRDHAAHRDCAAGVDTGACITNAEYGRSSAASVARHGGHSGGMGTGPTAAPRSAYEPGTASSPDFSSRSEFPSLPVQEFPPRQSPSSGGCISYSSALQQQRAPLMPSPSSMGGREEPHNARGSQGRRGGGVGNADGRPHKRGGGGGGARKHRRGGGEGRRAEEAAADAAAARSQPHYPQPQSQQSPAPQQQERRGGARRGRPVAATQAVAMDGEAEKHQFEAPEKDVKGELRLPRPPLEGEGTTRANSAGGRSSNQAGGVRVNASRGRRETRHSSLLRGMLKGGAERQGLRSGGGRKGSDAAMERHPLPPSDEQQLQRPGENRMGTQEDKPSSRKNSHSFVGENECSDEYPPLGSSGGVQDKSLERTAKSDGKDSVVKGQGDNIPKQQQSPRDKKAAQEAEGEGEPSGAEQQEARGAEANHGCQPAGLVSTQQETRKGARDPSPKEADGHEKDNLKGARGAPPAQGEDAARRSGQAEPHRRQRRHCSRSRRRRGLPRRGRGHQQCGRRRHNTAIASGLGGSSSGSAGDQGPTLHQIQGLLRPRAECGNQPGSQGPAHRFGVFPRQAVPEGPHQGPNQAAARVRPEGGSQVPAAEQTQVHHFRHRHRGGQGRGRPGPLPGRHHRVRAGALRPHRVRSQEAGPGAPGPEEGGRQLRGHLRLQRPRGAVQRHAGTGERSPENLHRAQGKPGLPWRSRLE
ncbi:uncharacterized protein LOC144179444 isoform X4 [Haemaphysalis longicornis]